ncbi:MAG: xylanase [Lachnospiraceae bacterium]|nr:xylanase [Lachnospiraceae bacterium]
MERKYPNQFARLGVSDKEVAEKIKACFDTIFFDPEENFYHEHDTDPESACMVDTGNIDARTEGMSYGMMMCVQMDRQDIFDKLWQFSKRYMYLESGRHAGYFAWSVQLDGKHNAEGPAPDGEEYYAMALFLAAGRWGNKTGIFDYEKEARDILRHCVHQATINENGRAMWDEENHYIRFVPEVDFSDPSYHLPHFYEVFAQRANEEDRAFWKDAADKSREYIVLSADPNTGMNAEYAEYDGTPKFLFDKNFAYYSDAYRVAMNIALDTLWYGKRADTAKVVTNLQNFFHGIAPEDYKAYQLDGTATEEPAMHPVAIIAVLAAASIASDSPYAEEYLKKFWEAPLRKGVRRYYDNCLYFFCLLMLGGYYQIY